MTDQNDNLEGGSQAEVLNQILAENDRLNKIVADLSKKLKDSAATNAVQAKEKENMKEAYRKLEQDQLRMTELERKIARVEKEKSVMEKTLAMLQVCFSIFKAHGYDLIFKQPFMKQSFFLGASNIPCSNCYVSDLTFFSLNLQNEVASMDEVREKNTSLEREKRELEQTLAALQVDIDNKG